VIWEGVDLAILYCEGNDGNWGPFDVSNADTFKREMEVGLRQATPIPVPPSPPPAPEPIPVPPPPAEIPFPTDGFERVILTPTDGAYNARRQPILAAEKVFVVDTAARGEIALEKAVFEGTLRWYPIKVLGFGWGWAREDVFAYVSDIPEPEPVTLTLSQSDLANLKVTRDILNRLP